MNEVTQEVTLVTETRDCIIYSNFLGFHGEDNANKLVFSFADGFIEGIATLHLERGKEKGNLTLDKVGDTYELPVKNSLLTEVGEIKFQLSLTTADNFFIFHDFVMHVDESIVSDSSIPEDYPTWVETANQKIIELDEEIARSEELRRQLLKDKENGVFNGEKGDKGDRGAKGEQGIQGEKGDAPIKGIDYWTEADKKEVIDEASQNVQPKIDNSLKSAKDYTDNSIARDFKDITYDETTATFIFTRHDNTTFTVDLPIEQTVKDGRYDETTQELVLVLVSGQEIRIPASGLIDDYTGVDSATIQLTISADNKITANIISGTISKTLLTTELQEEINGKLNSNLVGEKALKFTYEDGTTENVKLVVYK